MDPTTALMAIKLIDLVLLGLQAAPAIIARHNTRKAEIEGMVARGEDPTPAVVAAIDTVIEDLRAQLHAPLKPPAEA